MSLRLLVACLRGQWPENELSWLCLLSMWIEALLVTMRLLKTQIRNCRIWSDWKCNGHPLVVLALGRPEKAPWWLLSQLLTYFFCERCGNELYKLALVAWGQKSLFPRWPTLHNFFCYHIYWCGDTQKGHLGCCLSLYDSPLLLQSGLYSGMCIGTWKMDASPSSTSLGGIPKSYSMPPQVESAEKGKSNKSLGGGTKSIWDAIWDASPPHLGGRTGRNE